MIKLETQNLKFTYNDKDIQINNFPLLSTEELDYRFSEFSVKLIPLFMWMDDNSLNEINYELFTEKDFSEMWIIKTGRQEESRNKMGSFKIPDQSGELYSPTFFNGLIFK